MSQNPDVDRVSLDNRITSGGSSGGGTPTPPAQGTPTIPGTTFNPKIIDQCTPNAVTDVGTGYVFSIDIANDIATLPLVSGSSRTIQGFGIKLASYFPKAGTVPTEYAFWACKLTGKGNAPVNTSGAETKLTYSFDASVFKTQVLNNIASGEYSTQVSLLHADQVLFIRSNQTDPSRWADNFKISLIIQKSSSQAQLVLASDRSTSNVIGGDMQRGYSIGAAITGRPWWRHANAQAHYPATPIGWNPMFFVVAGFSGLHTQALPDRLKPLYPTSWYS